MAVTPAALRRWPLPHDGEANGAEMPVLLRYLAPFLFGLVLIQERTEQLLRSGHDLIEMHGTKFAAHDPKPLRLHDILHFIRQPWRAPP